MFWGLTLKPGKRHTEVFTEEICVSMATLESRKDFGERPDNYSHVVVKTQQSDFLLCTLVHGLQFQQNLNLKLMPKEKITFRVQGTSKVYLTGFTPSCPVDDVDVDLEGGEEAESHNQKAASEEQREDDQEDAGWLEDEIENTEILEDVIETLSGEELSSPEDQPENADRNAAVGKEDNFLSITELSNLPVKQERTDEGTEGTSQQQTPEKEGKQDPVSKTLQSGNAADEDGFSLEESGEEWILDEGEDVEIDVADLSEPEEDGRQLAGGFSCDVCDRLFSTEAEKSAHEENDHSLSMMSTQIQNSTFKQGRKYKCKYCGKLLANRSSQRRHEAIHARDKKIFKCHFCPKVFSYQHNLLRHEKLHKSSTLYRCLICNAGFQHIQTRDKHVLGHFKKDTQRCDLCRQVTCKGECMSTEEIMNSQSKDEEVDTIQPAMKYNCQYCPRTFQLKASRNRHQKTHSAASSASPSPSPSTKKAEKMPEPNVEPKTKECKYCYKPFVSDIQCKAHERGHMGEARPFLCRCCQKSFLDHLGRRKHELRHPEMRKFSCKFCHRRFSKQNLCRIHESQHSEERPFKCRHCDRCFSNKGSRVNHEVVHRNDGPKNVTPGLVKGSANAESTKSETSQDKTASSPQTVTKKLSVYPCRICGKKFASSSGRSRHHKLHGGLPIKMRSLLTCDRCKKAFINQRQLSEHKCSHGSKAISGKILNAKISQKEISPVQQQKQKPNISLVEDTICKYCNKEFSSRSACVIHVRLHTGEKPCCCEICDFRTNDPSTLNKHMKQKHNRLTVKCSKCPRKFLSQYSLQIHESHHSAAKAVHTCAECDKKFASKKELEFHRQVHEESEGFRPFRCTYCDKTFAAPETLKRHEHIHEKEQPFKCVKCGRHFKTNSGLQKHSVNCTDGKPHKCRYCSKSFSSINGCHLHEESHIVNRPFKCSQCDRGFLSNHSREIHEKTHTF